MTPTRAGQCRRKMPTCRGHWSRRRRRPAAALLLRLRRQRARPLRAAVGDRAGAARANQLRPGRPELAVEEKDDVQVAGAARCARCAVAPGEQGVLPSRPIVPGSATDDLRRLRSVGASRAPDRHADHAAGPADAGAACRRPSTRNQAITLGTERCFVVRPVDILSGIHVRGPASPDGVRTVCGHVRASPGRISTRLPRGGVIGPDLGAERRHGPRRLSRVARRGRGVPH